MPLADEFDARRLSRWARALRGLICYPGYPGKGRQAHGDASGPLFSGGRRHAEFHPRGRAVPCLAAGPDPRDPAARRGAWRPAAAPRAQADPPDRFRQADRTASAPAIRRCRGRQIDRQEISQPAAGADPPRRHVHDRTGALHGLSRRLPDRQSGLRADPRRRRAERPFADAAGRRARPRGDGAARPVQRAARCAGRSIASVSASPSRPVTGWKRRTGSGSPMLPTKPICAGSTANTATIWRIDCASTVSRCGSGFRASARTGSR